MIDSIQINDKDYSVALVDELDEAGNTHRVLLLKSDSEEQRLSPNTTDQELTDYANSSKEGHTL